FFSSRRRHTSSNRDWSSDVCSSDLVLSYFLSFEQFQQFFWPGNDLIRMILFQLLPVTTSPEHSHCVHSSSLARLHIRPGISHIESGRASCRERGERTGECECGNTRE